METQSDPDPHTWNNGGPSSENTSETSGSAAEPATAESSAPLTEQLSVDSSAGELQLPTLPQLKHSTILAKGTMLLTIIDPRFELSFVRALMLVRSACMFSVYSCCLILISTHFLRYMYLSTCMCVHTY